MAHLVECAGLYPPRWSSTGCGSWFCVVEPLPEACVPVDEATVVCFSVGSERFGFAVEVNVAFVRVVDVFVGWCPVFGDGAAVSFGAPGACRATLFPCSSVPLFLCSGK